MISKTNLLTLSKCNSHLQYYKIDFSFSIKLKDINSNVCEKYKIERKAQALNRTERDDRIPLSYLRPMRGVLDENLPV